jgi:hypothetical protein
MAQDMATQGFFGLKPGEIFAANTAPVQNYYQPVANQQQIVSGPVQGNIQNNANQMSSSQPSFWQGRDSNGYFVCPGCNWRMYSETPLGEYPRCPNCKQIMARGGLVTQNNGNQNYPTQNTFSQPQAYQAPAIAQNFGDQFAGRDIPQQFAPRAQAYQTPAIQPPPIYRTSPLVHDYRGVCTNCHQILNSQAPAAQTQGFAQNDPAGAQVAATCVLR